MYTREQLKSWTRFTSNALRLAEKHSIDLIECVHSMQFVTNSEPLDCGNIGIYMFHTSTGKVSISESYPYAKRMWRLYG